MFLKDGAFFEERILDDVEDNGLKLSIASDGQFCVNGYQIPYKKLHWLFKTFGRVSEEWSEFENDKVFSVNQIHTFEIDGIEYDLDHRKDVAGESYEFRKGWKPHCINGPATVTPTGKMYFLDGQLHNLYGPAREDSDGALWAIDGGVYKDVIDYVENHPFAAIKRTNYSHYASSVVKACGMAVVRSDDHTFLLEKGQAENKAANFLFECLYRSLEGYRLVKYEAPTASFHRIFNALNKVEDFIVVPTGTREKTLRGTYQNKEVRVKYDKATDEMSCKIYEYFDPDQLSPTMIESIHVKLNEGERTEEERNFRETDLVNHKLNRRFVNKGKNNLIKDKLRFSRHVDDWIRERNREHARGVRQKEVDRAAEDLLKEWEERPPIVDISPLDQEGLELVNSNIVIVPDDEFKKEFARRFQEHLEDYVEDFFKETSDPSSKIYGISVSMDAAQTAQHSSSENSFFWTNASNELHSYDQNTPSVIFPDGILLYHDSGKLHRMNGPAVESLYSVGENEWWLWGKELSQTEFTKYNPKTKSVEYKNHQGLYHRDDGPAIIIFNEDGSCSEHFYENGICLYSVKEVSEDIEYEKFTNVFMENDVVRTYKVTPREPKVRKVTKRTPKVEFTELSKEEVEALRAIFRDHKPHLMKFKDEIHEAARKAILKKNGGVEPEYEEDDEPELKEEEAEAPKETEKMTEDIEVTKTVRSTADLSGGRVSQIKNGFVFGLKKGLINNSSQMLSRKLVSYSPLEDNEWAERFVQICILVGLAEMFKRMPEGLADKIHMSKEMRLNLASDLRFTSGENIGRDLVDIAAHVLPLFAEVIKGVTAEELEDLANHFEISEEEEDTETETEDVFNEDTMNVADLFSAVAEDEVVKETVKQEVTA